MICTFGILQRRQSVFRSAFSAKPPLHRLLDVILSPRADMYAQRPLGYSSLPNDWTRFDFLDTHQTRTGLVFQSIRRESRHNLPRRWLCPLQGGYGPDIWLCSG